MADIVKVELVDNDTQQSFIINSQGRIEVSIEENYGPNSYRISDIDDDATPNYYGFLKADGSWYILKETVSAGANTYRYVAGSSGYNWSNRAS